MFVIDEVPLCAYVCMCVWELEFSITVLLISLSQETAQAITLHLLDLIKEPLFPAEAEASQPLV